MVAAQPLQGEVVLVVAEVGAGLGAEAFPVGAGGDAGQLDDGALAELVFEVGVDDGALGLLHELHQAADPAAGQLEHRQGDVDPPLVAGELVEQQLLGRDRGDRGLAEQGGGDVLDLLAEPLDEDGVALEVGELEAQQEQVEPLGVLVVVALGGGQPGQVLGDVAGLLRWSAVCQASQSA